jgi:PKD repeat protein
MEVKDEGGLTARATRPVTVDQYHSAPTAFFTVTPESGRTTNYFVFDASGSWDGEDNVSQLKVRWDFDGDDTWDTQFGSSKAAVWIYALPGTYVAKLEVKDTEGMSGSTTRLVKVDPGNLKPTAFFTVAPESGTIETLFQFDASGSSDTEDPPQDLRFRWDWNNDAAYDTGYREENKITHRFDVAGQYVVVLEVSDSEGYASTYSVLVPVSNPNTPPKADFTITPETGTIDTLFAFDASICTDLEDSLDQLEVRWDWDNDDIYDTDFMAEKVSRRKFTETGTFIIKVQVRDSGGLTATKARLVTVR